MADGIYVAQDIGGFGRLAQINMQKREQARADRLLAMQEENAALNRQQAQLQIQNAQNALAEQERVKTIRTNLGVKLQGVSQDQKYKVGYDYLSETDPTLAQKWMQDHLDQIASMSKIDPVGTAEYVNTNMKYLFPKGISYTPDKTIQAEDDDGNVVLMEPIVDSSGKATMRVFAPPEGVTIPSKNKESEEDYIDVVIKGQKKRLKVADYQRMLDREEQRNQAKQFHDENLELRKLLGGKALELKKRVSTNVSKDISEKESTLQKYSEMLSSFNDDYAGAIIGGPTTTKILAKTPFQKERVSWWKKFNELDSVMRNRLFGATLTGYELENWKSQTVDENTDPEVVRQRIMDRLKWSTDALTRELQGYEERGYDLKPKVEKRDGQKVEMPSPNSSSKKNDPLGIR